MQSKIKKEKKFKKRLQNALATENLQQQREFIKRIAAELNLTLLDCAAALVYLSQPNLYQPVKKAVQEAGRKVELTFSLAEPKNRMVRYRLEVGSLHQVSGEAIKDVLVEESGVDRKWIRRVDIHENYTIVELPEGMPADIFHLLADIQIGEQKLGIKRLKPQRKYRRPRSAV